MWRSEKLGLTNYVEERRMRATFIAAMAALYGCSSSHSATTTTTTDQANPCATRGASYLLSFKQTSGNCPDIPDQLLNINPDGTIPSGPVTCDQITQEGCTARDTNCVLKKNGCTSTVTTDVTFTKDGASVSGLESLQLACDDKSSCSGTFRISGSRQ